MLRTVLAVLAGYAIIGVLVVGTDGLWVLANPAYRSMKNLPGYYFQVSLAADCLYSVLGAYVCAIIAKRGARNAAWGLMAFGELMGLVSSIMYWNLQPHWWSVALLIAYPPLVWLGYRLRARSAARA